MKVLDYDGLDYYNSLIENKYAPKNSPAFTGTPTAPTPTAGDNSTKIATTAYVKSNLGNYATLNGATFTGAVNGVTPTAGDNSTKLATTAYVQAELADYVTLNDLNTTLSDYVTSSDLSTELGDYLPLAGGTMSGNIVYDGLDEDEFLIGRTEGDGSRDIGWFRNNENVGANIALRSSEFDEEYGQAGEFKIIAKNGSNIKELTGTPDGTLKWCGIDLTPKTYSIKNTSSDVNVASGSVKNLLSFSITKGTWLVQVVASFPNNSSGYRRLGISTDTSSSYMDRYSVQTVHAASGTPTQLTFTTCLRTSGTTTYYLNAYQTSGSTLAVTAGVLLFRLSNTAS